MNFTILIATAISVSVDSFFCGLTLTLKKNEYFKIILGIFISVFTLCLIGSLLGEKAGAILSNYAEIIGGFLLIIISILNLKTSKPNSPTLITIKKSTLKDSIIIGAIVGLDGCVGCFSLSLISSMGIIIPITITIVHLLFISLSILVSKLKIAELLCKYKELPEIILFTLGAYKIISAL